MDDIAPELLKAVQKQFTNAFYADPTVRSILPKVYDKKATYGELHTLAKRAGELCGEALTTNLTADVLPDGKLYCTIADKVVGEMFRSLHVDVDGYAQKVQEGLNSRANIGLKPQSVPVDNDRINGVVNAASHTETLEETHSIIERSAANYSLHVVDEAVRVNAQFQYNAGLEPKVIRKTNGKCCKWCSGLAGVYDYDDVSETGSDVWRRHLDCDCVIEYDPGDGKRERVNNYRRRESTDTDPAELMKRRQSQGLPDDRASDKIAVRKEVVGIEDRSKTHGQRIIESSMREQLSIANNSDTLVDAIINNHEDLRFYTPESMKSLLESMGYSVIPLSGGNFKGVPFEEGGGFKVLFGGDGYLQYHPEEHSHHDGAYWKICNGKQGKRRFNLDGSAE